MTLRKKSVDKNVKNDSKTNHFRSETAYNPEHKTASLVRKQKKLSQNNEIFLEKTTAGGFKKVK